MSAKIVGDPLKENTHVGAQAREDLMKKLQTQVQALVALGAAVLIGGQPLTGDGFYYPPTILTGVKSGMPAHQEKSCSDRWPRSSGSGTRRKRFQLPTTPLSDWGPYSGPGIRLRQNGLPGV